MNKPEEFYVISPEDAQMVSIALEIAIPGAWTAVLQRMAFDALDRGATLEQVLRIITVVIVELQSQAHTQNEHMLIEAGKLREEETDE